MESQRRKNSLRASTLVVCIASLAIAALIAKHHHTHDGRSKMLSEIGEFVRAMKAATV